LGQNDGMYVSARSDYALRALLALAAEARPLTAEELARKQDLPVSYLEATLLELRRGGIVGSRRGPNAGYRFLRDPETITPADVIRVLEGPLAEVRGERPEATSYRGPATSLQQLWVALRASLRSVLEGVSIAQLARGELPPRLSELLADPDAWAPH
jgi:Rrf2 family protein